MKVTLFGPVNAGSQGILQWVRIWEILVANYLVIKLNIGEIMAIVTLAAAVDVECKGWQAAFLPVSHVDAAEHQFPGCDRFICHIQSLPS